MNKFMCPAAHVISLVILLGIFNCKKNPHDDTPQTNDPLSEKITASIRGRITDENGKPVNSASVHSGGSATTSDLNGYFKFDNIELPKNAGSVIAEKTGYLVGCRTILPNTAAINNVEIQLIPRVTRGNFSAAAGGNVTIQNATSLNFPANGVTNTANNTNYTGTVNVIGAYLDPLDPKLSLLMPGNLTGLTKNNELKVLQTFGMIAVELEGSNGERLNLASGKTATITMPISSSLLTSAPATIPLWFFDESKGLWIEEGAATKQGGSYVGTVSHFTFWNVDVPNNFITLKLTLKDQNGQPAPGLRIELTNTTNNSTAYGITDSAGVASGAVPSGLSLQMRVYNKCNNLFLQKAIGPFSGNTDIGVVNVDVPPHGTITVSGTVKNCNLSPVTNGYAELLVEGLTYRAPINNGTFSITIERCSNLPGVAQLIPVDLQSNQQGSTTNLNITSGSYSTGDLIACGTSTLEYINFTIGGTTQNFIFPVDSFSTFRQNTTTSIVAYPKVFTDSASWQYTSFGFSGNLAPGTYTIDASSFIVTKGFHLQYNATGPMALTVTDYGGTGQFIAGSFSGTMREFYTNATVSGSCSFRVKRRF
jgi:hypothetical protein